MISSLSQTLITGVYRTGSEYISQWLNCHPEMDVSMYRINIPRFVLNKYDPISEADQYKAALRDLAERVKRRYGLELDISVICKELDGLPSVTYAELYDRVMTRTYLGETKRHWAEKNQLLWREIPWFVNNMPNGKAIIIIRDPRSVLLSFKKFTYADPPAYLGAVFNCHDAMLHALKYAKMLNRDRFYWLKYEDFVQDPMMHATRIWSWIGLSQLNEIAETPWTDAYGKPWYSNSSFQGNDPNTTFDSQAAITRWKTGLSQEEIALTEIVCREMMDAFGYERSILNTDLFSVLSLFSGDESITGWFWKWLVHGEGVEAFPVDPTKPENWEDADRTLAGDNN